MRTSEYPDCFVVINGPEDGTEFPIVRAPFYVGRNPECAVNVRLDHAVRSFHALITVVSDGYRIRRNDAAPVYVDGKRAGMFWSRIARSGSRVQVGNTTLCVECVPEGLASRSYGMVTESDLGWAIQQTARGALKLGAGVLRFFTRVFGRLLGSWLTAASAVVLLYFFWPRFHYLVLRIAYTFYYRVMEIVNGVGGTSP